MITWVQNQELKPNHVMTFYILDMERFEVKHQKFVSLQHQLNNFGFRK